MVVNTEQCKMMASTPNVPTIPEQYSRNAASKNPMASNRNFEFVHSHSIAVNFGNMIAQSDRKPSKPAKTKSKKRPSIYGDGNAVKFDNPNASQSMIQQNSFQILRPQPVSATQFAPPQTRHIPPAVSNRTYPNNANPWQVQWNTVHHGPQIKQEPVEDASSVEMDLSSGSEAEAPLENHESDDASPNMLERPRVTLDQSENHKVNDLSDFMDLSSGPDVEDGSGDESVISRRASTTPFNDSAASSHTSANLSNDLRSSIEDCSTANKILKAPSSSSDLSSQLSPAKSTTPAGPVPSSKPQARKSGPRQRIPRAKKVNFSDRRSRASIPENLTAATMAQQGIQAAYASRLNPFALHHQEYLLLREHICHLHVTAYLNIRNRILRLWVRNPLVQVTAEEAAGCSHSARWLSLANIAYQWLVRRGYINFGCLEIPNPPDLKVKRYKLKRSKQKTIAIIGAGMAGLGCARQLDGLIRHHQEKWTAAGEDPPNIVLLEGRNRIGGRLYSHPLRSQQSQGIPANKRCTAEMGAHIIIGFDHGNPLSMIIRGQLALHYHTLRDNSTLHDIDGKAVDEVRDDMVEQLYNDCLDRASAYRHRLAQPLTVEGEQELIELGKDPQQKGGPSIAEVEKETPNIPAAYSNDDTENVPGGMDKLTGKAHMVPGPREKQPPAVKAEQMGWHLGENVLSYDDLNLDAVAKSSQHPTLGAAMDEAVKQYQFLLDLTPQDMRLINWHYANLEYANAANVGKLSLGGWDQDAGNEFSGRHAQIIGGYQQVPRAILQAPRKLNLRTHKVVKRVEYNVWSGNSKTPRAKVHCDDGDMIDADYVVLTTPLGVLKGKAVEFSPPLPSWKLGPINRLGFGVLNKCILVYNEPFWDVDQDMFGLLRDSEVQDSLDQEDYVTNRGRFYFFWNCIKTSGRPVLISLMAGDAAYQAENTPDAQLVSEVTHELARIFKDKEVPLPQESIITRWGQDRFARGTYSYVAAEAMPGDYDAMAQPVGNLHFAGEATCATHPATVHGAYISGLRAASDIIDDLLGPIEIPKPLVSWPTNAQLEKIQQETPPQPSPTEAQKIRTLLSTPMEDRESRKARLEIFEAEIIDAINQSLGFRPAPPKNPRSNAFLLYTSENWNAVKKYLAENASKHERNDIRGQMGHQWNALTEEEKRPYKERAEAAKVACQMDALTYDARLREWDAKAIELRRQYIREHPGVLTDQEEKDMWEALEQFGELEGGERKAKKASGYADAKEEEFLMAL